MSYIAVIGGSSGIGAKTIDILLHKGFQVWHLTRNPSSLPREGLKEEYFDVSSAQAFPQAPGPLSGLLYCPGTITLKPFHNLSLQDFENDWRINFLGAVRTLQAFYPALKAQGDASVVLFSSVAAAKGMPFHASIAAVKAALEGLGRSLAAEWAPAVRVNVVAPSLTDTPLASRWLNTPEKRQNAANRHPLKRIGSAEDAAALVAFLLSSEAAWITGQVIHVDGGLSTLTTS
ncbi:MAG: SDR family NAD(P)-dependent oxidoreductase [Flavobacteriales bacterium]|nr:SDR family NAD(P)-dependent oxidoreductase [Flavobacteriales bacterium]MCX7768226.1 SDR family NAD(P)-dependent oxidoreductase [Flavobacteriales bacterium]MDW8410136.1 SDR family NAD(P)-dependent oxidoreductase [Flavobacteriales bacterium]